MLLLFALCVAHADPVDPFSVDSVGDVRFSPDGEQVAYVQDRWDREEDQRLSSLWVADLRGQETTRLTFEVQGATHAQWSEDGRWIYFLSSAPEEKRQVYRVEAAGGARQRVTRAKEGVRQFQVQGGHVYFTSPHEHRSEDPFAALREAHDLDYGHGVLSVDALWDLDLSTWRATVMLDESEVIRDFRVSPSGSRVAMLTTPDEELIFNEGWSKLKLFTHGAVLTLPDAMWREGGPSPYGWLGGVAWSPSSEKLSVRVDWDGYPGELYVVDLSNLQVDKLPRSGDWTFAGTRTLWSAEDTLCFQVEDHARQRVLCSDLAGEVVDRTPGDVVVWSYDLDDKGRLAVSRGSPTRLPELWVERRGAFRQISHTNDHLSDADVPEVSLTRWTAPDGTPVEGVLMTPAGAEGPLPTIVRIHGGPTASSLFVRNPWVDAVGRGWAVFLPNYRGSTGYGDAFLTDLIGHENEVEVGDILAGVDHLVQMGIADPEKLAVMGWSNGGFLTNCLITTTPRFKAASSGAGVFDQGLQWLTEDTPGHVINYMEGMPWDLPEAYQKASPLYKADQIVTPTLIHVGEDDPRVPAAHARGLYRSLFHYLNVPVELVVYPHTGHGLRTWSDRAARLAWDQAWFDYFVLGITPEGAASP